MILKKMISTFAVIASTAILSSLTAYAAPEIMPDGELFDAEYYAEQNPDVVAVIGTDTISLYTHYITMGINEGRLPYSPELSNYDIATIIVDQSRLLVESAIEKQATTPVETSTSDTIVKELGHGITFISSTYVPDYWINQYKGSFHISGVKFTYDKWANTIGELSIKYSANDLQLGNLGDSISADILFLDADGFEISENSLYAERRDLGRELTKRVFVPRGTVTIKIVEN